MTTSETLGVAGLCVTVAVNVSALAWGAAKISAAVTAIKEELAKFEKSFKDFLIIHAVLDKEVGRHTTNIALIAQKTGVDLNV